MVMINEVNCVINVIMNNDCNFDNCCKKGKSSIIKNEMINENWNLIL